MRAQNLPYQKVARGSWWLPAGFGASESIDDEREEEREWVKCDLMGRLFGEWVAKRVFYENRGMGQVNHCHAGVARERAQFQPRSRPWRLSGWDGKICD